MNNLQGEVLTIPKMSGNVGAKTINIGGGGGAEALIEPLSVSENGTYTAPDGVDGYSPVTVNVPIPDGYIQPSGTLDITENGTCDVKNYASVNVNVAGSGGDSQLDAFLEGTITEVNSNATRIREYSFRNSDNLVTVNLPNAESINTYAFYSCDVLKTVNIPNVTDLSSYCFDSCKALEEIVLPKVRRFRNYTFQYCSSLKKVDAFEVTEVGTKVFNNCTNLETLILRSTTSVATLVNKNAFDFSGISRSTGYIYVPAALVDSYKVATNWSNFADQFRAIEDHPEICGG